MRWIPRKIEAAAACRRVALMDVDCRRAIDCESARGPDADRHAKLLIHLAVEGSTLNAYSHSAFSILSSADFAGPVNAQMIRATHASPVRPTYDVEDQERPTIDVPSYGSRC